MIAAPESGVAFETALRGTLERLSDKAPKLLAESMRYSLLQSGKRIRPRLVFAAAQILELDSRAATAAAVCLEMIHCFTLIHDDLPCMDDDDFRRGQPANHKKFGEPVALLAGDSLMSLAISAYLEAGLSLGPEPLLAGLNRILACLGPFGVIGGQAAELELGKSSSLKDLQAVHDAKTGALFSASVLVPADLAGMPAQSPEAGALAAFGRELGRAFQVADDLDDHPKDQNEAADPSSILHYVSATEARKMATNGLSSAVKALQSVWSKNAAPLTAIGDEVLSRLKGT